MRRIANAFLLFLTLSACVCTPKMSAPEVLSTPGPVDEGFILTDFGVKIHQDPRELPVVIAVLPQAEDWFSEMLWAADDWNTRLGFQAFIVIQTKELVTPASAVVPVVADPEKHNGAFTHFIADDKTGVMLLAYIVMPTGRISIRAARLVAEHELGHVLGLRHDDDMPLSLMHPTLASLDVAPTHEDIERLQEMYAQTSTASTSSTAEFLAP